MLHYIYLTDFKKNVDYSIFTFTSFKVKDPNTSSTGVPITDPKYFSKISVEELAHVLRSDNETPMPMLQERHQVLTFSC